MTHDAHTNSIAPARRYWLAVTMLLSCLLPLGCNWHVPRGEGFHDEMSGWSRQLRNQEKSEGTPLGTSEKALEIERNLGYH